MKYAVLRIAGKQYRVSEKDEFLVDRIDEPSFETLLMVDEDKVLVGSPVTDKAEVKLKILGEEKGKKIYIQKFKAKSRFDKRTGFRPIYTRLLVEKLSVKS